MAEFMFQNVVYRATVYKTGYKCNRECLIVLICKMSGTGSNTLAVEIVSMNKYWMQSGFYCLLRAN